MDLLLDIFIKAHEFLRSPFPILHKSTAGRTFCRGESYEGVYQKMKDLRPFNNLVYWAYASLTRALRCVTDARFHAEGFTTKMLAHQKTGIRRFGMRKQKCAASTWAPEILASRGWSPTYARRGSITKKKPKELRATGTHIQKNEVKKNNFNDTRSPRGMTGPNALFHHLVSADIPDRGP